MGSNNDYYRDTLSANNLKRCYELAPPVYSNILMQKSGMF